MADDSAYVKAQAEHSAALTEWRAAFLAEIRVGMETDPELRKLNAEGRIPLEVQAKVNAARERFEVERARLEEEAVRAQERAAAAQEALAPRADWMRTS